jgi:2,3-bisphosphoglycerate-independent phosphoglycerate mutase
MRCILVILDGLGDRGQPLFHGKTPLVAARTPNLDRLARLGMNGLYHAWQQGLALPSEIAHFLMFGYDLGEFPGRGYLEALGEGIPVGEGEVALLARLVSVRPAGAHLILDLENPRADARTCKALQEDIRFFSQDGIHVEFIPAGGIKGIVLLKGGASPAVTDSNPIHEGRPLMAVLPLAGSEEDPAAQRTAGVLNDYVRWCYARLSDHLLNRQRLKQQKPPLNAVGLQRAGTKKDIQPFSAKWGLKALAIASGAIYQGLSRHFGMDLKVVKDTAKPGQDLTERLQVACEASNYDFVFIHTKAADEAAHTKDPRKKKAVIQALDQAFAYALQEIVPDPDTLLVITADHATNSAGQMIHSGETVPLTMVGKYPRVDGVTKFDEISCAAGGLGSVRGPELMYLILNFLDRAKLVGLRDAPEDQPYTPGPYTPLTLD